MMGGDRRGFFSRLTALWKEVAPAPDALHPSWRPPAESAEPSPAAEPSPSSAASPSTAPSAAPPGSPSPHPTVVARKRVRPPGALGEAAFLQACSRCGACLAACPEEAIVKDPDGLPMLEPARIPCALCVGVPCAAACPPEAGALVAIARDAIRIAEARVSERLCLNHHEAESCERCFDWCPVPAALVRGARGIPSVAAAHCTGCGACARHCAAYPVAIALRPR